MTDLEKKVTFGHSGPVLVLCVGLPRSGKSTWAREQGVPIVNPDAIRLALHGQTFRPEAEGMVWAIAETMVRSLFGAGHRVVILDATSVTLKRRERWQSNAWRTYYRVFGASAELCKSRLTQKGTEMGEVIDRMARSYEPLSEAEARWLL